MRLFQNLTFCIGLILSSCQKDNSSSQTGTMTVLIDVVDNSGHPMPLGSKGFVDVENGLSLSTFKLYLSDFGLKGGQTARWDEANSYHLLRLNNSTNQISFQLKSVPSGVYDTLYYAFGIDSAHNHTLDHEGDLDPSNGMAWNWNTGYRFLVMEGGYYGPLDSSDALIWHVGTDENYRKTKLVTDKPIIVTTGKDAVAHLIISPTALATGPNKLLPFSQNDEIQFDSVKTAKLADNMVSTAIRYGNTP